MGTTAMMKSDSGFTNSEAFKEQKEEVQATFNIDKSQEKGNNNNVQILEDDAPVQVLIKSKNSRGTSIAQTMALKIDMEIKRAGILGTTITKKDIQYFEQHPDIERIEVDQTLYALGNKERHLRKLAEETPYGIPMVLQDVNFWNSLEEPTSVPTATESSVITFSPTSTESLISFAPTNTASLSDNQPTPLPTPFPTGLPPTLHPTQTQPTLFPTGRQPTPFPTSIPLTPWPTDLPPTSYPTERPPTEYPTHTPPTLYPTHSQPTPFPTNLRSPTFFSYPNTTNSFPNTQSVHSFSHGKSTYSIPYSHGAYYVSHTR